MSRVARRCGWGSGGTWSGRWGPRAWRGSTKGDHTALEGVLERAEDRVALTQARLFDHGELFRDEELTARGRWLYNAIITAQIADERAERGLTEEQDLERGRDRDLGDDFGL